MASLTDFQSLGPEINESEMEFTEKDKLGQGSYGVVYKGKCRGYPVAIKVPRLPKGAHQFSEDQLKAFREEIKVMSKLYNPRIALFMGAFVSPTSIKIVTELLDGDFERYLHNKKNQISLYQRAVHLRQAAEGMAWLHGAGVVHCDYKPSNLLWEQKTKSVKVCDFGLSMLVKQGQVLQNEEAKGTPLYIAPEVVLEEGSSSARDVYSYGISIYSFVERKEPFSNHNNLQQFLRAITREKDPERPPLPKDEQKCTKSLKTLAEDCWQADYKKRPSFQEIIKRLDNDILVDCAVFDEEGRKFWKTHFAGKEGLKTSVQWETFIQHFVKDFSDKPIDPKSSDFKCLQVLFSPNGKDVELEHFGEIIGFFTHLSKNNWISYVVQLMFQDFFWGTKGSTEAQNALGKQPEGTYLVRFSSKGSNYTLSFVGGKKIWHTRIIHPYAENKFALDGAPNKIYSSLPDLLKATKESGTITEVCPGAPYKALFGDNKEEGGYATLQYDGDSDDDLEN